ncbi:hypothetical protein K437DRAFT_254799 [Tilletiaria anomala UBC 951]|uniref:Uncharacterized protein n=1 Tax=Tilletiaria anomala (strain ATCC 24038 / CBS 436.72 / UBC 951) TaxID=1037660 RepID=A0A066WL95_TILAU|nr:uncharacterized protein K437DRAFT_254799 [Tilletiaria anomala UBC 951]KDN51390.1 hypothetical protein K437DRAFT_254799 [Tilletiaria anomala UBC 951]
MHLQALSKQQYLSRDMHFWLGAKTTRQGCHSHTHSPRNRNHAVLTSGRERVGRLSRVPSRLPVLSGGVRTFKHGETVETPIFWLLQITISGGGSRSVVVIDEVNPSSQTLNEGDVLVLDEGSKLTA